MIARYMKQCKNPILFHPFYTMLHTILFASKKTSDKFIKIVASFYKFIHLFCLIPYRIAIFQALPSSTMKGNDPFQQYHTQIATGKIIAGAGIQMKIHPTVGQFRTSCGNHTDSAPLRKPGHLIDII
jgi:hypothetical protein